jgi:hypothetical protein
MSILDFVRIGSHRKDILSVHRAKKLGLFDLIEGKETFTPSWRSYDGLDSWSETLADQLSVSLEVARALLVRHGDADTIYQRRGDKALIDKINEIKAFDNPNCSLVSIDIWAHDCPYIYYDLFEEIGNYLTIWVPEQKDLSKLRSVLNNYLINWTQDAYTALFTALSLYGIDNLSIDDMSLIAVTGTHIVERKSRNVLKAVGVKTFNIINDLEAMDDINVQYLPNLDEEDIKVRHLWQMGVKPSKVFKGCSKKERSLMHEQYDDEEVNSIYEAATMDDVVLFRYPEFPRHWLNYCKSLLQADWAWRHRSKLQGSRELHGPAGQTAILYYHTLLEHVTDDMLVNGAKTAWRRVITQLEELDRQKWEAQWGANVPLPTIKHKHFKGVKPLTFSDDLKKEGRVMHHCVGGYIQSCLDKKSYIYHVGDAAPAGATLEICRQNGRWRRMQIFAYNDKAASVSARQTADAFVRSLNDK